MNVFAQIDDPAREQTEQPHKAAEALTPARPKVTERHHVAHMIRKKDAPQPKKLASVKVAMTALRRVHENRHAQHPPQPHTVNPKTAATKTAAAASRPPTKQRHGKVADAG
jgi:hypothetical protein